MISMLLALSLLVNPPCYGETDRKSASVAHFKKLHPCPAGPDKGSKKRCEGYVVDHKCPLACCGADEPFNMQWQTVKAAKEKDRWELNCVRSCK